MTCTSSVKGNKLTRYIWWYKIVLNFKAAMIDNCANKLKFKLFVITKNNLEPLPSVFELTAINVIKNKLRKVKNVKS